MDEFENVNEQPMEEAQPRVDAPQPDDALTWGYPPSRHEEQIQRPLSPYGDTPCQSVPTAPKQKKSRKNAARVPGWLIPVAAGLIAVSCAVTALCVSVYWENRVQELEENFAARFKGVQEQLGAALSNDGYEDLAAPENGSLTPGQVYAANVNAVVAVSGYVSQTDFYGYSEYESFGSGFILSEDGYVVTNYHVVEGAADIQVTLYDSNVYPAELKGYDATNDIALLKIEAVGLPFVTIGSSDALAVGDRVAAIGNPLGELTSTLTVGYVSAKDRIITTEGTAINMLQTDAAINSGNSGGPLFNMKGEVVGITTAKYSGTSSSGATIEGIGFAIPIDDVLGMLEDIRDFGYVTGAYLGVMVKDVSETAVEFGLPEGAYVEKVTEGYAAEKAGLQHGDIITALGEYEVSNMTTLTRALRKFEGGDTTEITVYREGSYVTMTITLDEKPREETEAAQEEETYLMPGDEGFEEWYREFIERQFGQE